MRRLVATDLHAETLPAVLGSAHAEPAAALGRFVHRAMTEALAPRRPAARTHRLLAIHGALTARPSELGPLASELETLDPSAALLDAIDASMGRLLAAGATSDGVESARTPRARLTAALMRASARILEEAGLFDPRALVVTLDEDLEVSRTLDLSGAMLGVLARTHAARRAQGGGGVRIVVPSEGGEGAAAALVLEAWERQLAALPDAPELEFRPTARAAAAPTVIEASGIAAEARAVAGVVLDALASGAAIDRIGVVVDEEDATLGAAIERAFRDAGIAFSRQARGADVQPELVVVLSLVDMAEGQIGRGALVDLLRSPGIHPGAWVGDATEASAVVRAAALAHALRALPLAYDATGARFAQALVGTPWMRAAVTRVADEVARLRACTTRGAFGAALLRLMDVTRLGDPSARTIHTSLGASRADLDALDAIAAGARAAAALRRIAEELVDAGRALPDPPTTIGELGRELRRAIELAPTNARGASPRVGAVRIGPARESVDRGLELVVVAGLDSNAFDAPRLVDAWLDPHSIDRLPRELRPRSRALARAILDAELEAALGTAGRVVLTRSVLDEEGRERGGPHALLRRAVDAGAAPTREPVSPLASRATVLHARQRSLARLVSGEAVPSELVARVAIERERSDFFREAGRAAGAFSGLVEGRSTDLVASAVGGRTPARGVAVTTAETAAACAFRVLAERVCGARPFVEAIEADSALERGNLLHDALFRAFEAQRGLPPSTDAEAASREIRRRLEAELLGKAPSALNLEARRMCIDDAMQVVDAALRSPDDMTYALGEVKFGRPDDPLGAVSGRSSSGVEIWFEGKIDRVDLSADRRRARVIDYKSGKAPRARGIGETSFQLPLYALAVRRALPVVETSGLYLSLRRGGEIETVPRDPKAQALAESALETAATAAADAVVRVHAGELAPRPRSPGKCAWCSSRDICRRPAVSASAPTDARAT